MKSGSQIYFELRSILKNQSSTFRGFTVQILNLEVHVSQKISTISILNSQLKYN